MIQCCVSVVGRRLLAADEPKLLVSGMRRDAICLSVESAGPTLPSFPLGDHPAGGIGDLAVKLPHDLTEMVSHAVLGKAELLPVLAEAVIR
jgi:hypothetical protein